MAGARADQRLRVSVVGLDDATFEWQRSDVPTDHRGNVPVRHLPQDRAQRSSGRQRYEVTVDGWVFTVEIEDAARAELRERAVQDHRDEGHHGEQVIRAQLPGRLVRLWVAEGDTVEAGQRLLAIEAMKMENEVRAPRAGTIASIKVAVGASVELGDELVTVT